MLPFLLIMLISSLAFRSDPVMLISSLVSMLILSALRVELIDFKEEALLVAFLYLASATLSFTLVSFLSSLILLGLLSFNISCSLDMLILLLLDIL